MELLKARHQLKRELKRLLKARHQLKRELKKLLKAKLPSKAQTAGHAKCPQPDSRRARIEPQPFGKSPPDNTGLVLSGL